MRSNLLNRARLNVPGIRDSTPTTNEILAWLQARELVCEYSGVKLTIDNMSIDHKIPITRGGDNSLSNLAIASLHMNLAKGTMTDVEFKQILAVISTWEDHGEAILRRLKLGRY